MRARLRRNLKTTPLRRSQENLKTFEEIRILSHPDSHVPAGCLTQMVYKALFLFSFELGSYGGGFERP